MASTEEQAVQLLNEAKLASDAASKVDRLKGLQELVIRKDPSLIPSFLPDVLELQVDPSSVVRRFLLDFFDAAAQVAPTAALLLDGVRCVSLLVCDEAIATAKRALASAYTVYRASVALVAAQGSDESVLSTTPLEVLWQEAGALKVSVGHLAASTDANLGIRLGACRFLEQATMLLTAEVVPVVPGILTSPTGFPASNKVTSKSSLVREGEQLLTILVSLLKSSTTDEFPAPLAAASIRAAMGILDRRPQFTGRLLPLLLSLAKSGKFKPGDGDTPAASMLVTALKSALDSKHPIAMTWRKKVADGLAALGIAPSMDTNIQKPSEVRSLKRPRQENEGQDHQVDTASAHPAAAPALPATSDVQPPLPSDPEALRQADAAIKGLIAAKDAATLVPLMYALQPAVLADLFFMHLSNLPPRHLWVPDSVPHEPWIHELVQKFQATDSTLAPSGGVPSSSDVTAGAAKAPPGSTTAPPPLKEMRPVSNDVAQHEPPQEPPMSRRATPPPPTRATPALPQVSIPEDVFAPLELSEQQVAGLRRDAVLRILRTHKTAAHGLRIALVARLAAQAPDMDNSTEGILQYLLEDFHVRGGLQLVLTWLNALFSEAYDACDATATSCFSGTRYEDVLLSVLEGLREKLPPSDRSLVSVLLDAPVLPMPRVREFLMELCVAGPEWATLALVAVRDVTLARPPSRTELLAVALQASISEDQDMRTKAVRLLANRLFPEASMMGQIEEFARQQLSMLASRVAAAPTTPVDECNGGTQGEETRDGAADAARRCALYCALCTKKHSLLRRLFETHAAASDVGKAALEANAPGLAKTLGPGASALLAVVNDPPSGSLELVLRMLGVLTETTVPPPPLVDAALALFKSTDDARVLPLVLPGANRAIAVELLPKVLELPPEALRSAISRLIVPLPGSEESPLFSPTELLVALHTIDSKGDAATLRFIMTGISACINSPDLFPPETLAATINKLLTRVPLPQLFMRTIIQSLAAAPRLRPFVVGILGQLAAKQVWKDATQWRGWVMAAQQSVPESFPAWLQLPATVLEQALQAVPSEIRSQLAAYALSPQCKVSFPAATREVLTKVSS